MTLLLYPQQPSRIYVVLCHHFDYLTPSLLIQEFVLLDDFVDCLLDAAGVSVELAPTLRTFVLLLFNDVP